MSARAPRRSTRASNAATKKYTNDAFKASGLALLSASGSGISSDESSEAESRHGKRRVDEDFTVEHVDEDDDVGSVSDAEALEDANESNTDPDASISDVLSDSDIGTRSGPTSRRGDNTTPRGGPAKDPRHSTRSGYRDAYYEDITGDDPDDVAAYNATKLKFWDDVTVPHRSYEQNAKAGLSYPYILSADEKQRHLKQQWEWYGVEGGRQALCNNQDVRLISEAKSKAYTVHTRFARNIVLGPHRQQKKITLQALGSLNVDSAFPSPSIKSDADPEASGRGWLLNLGQSVHTLAWVPGHNHGTQYLSASTWVEDATPSGKEDVSAFGPWPSVCSAIQIWSFNAHGGQQCPATLDGSIKPTLHSVLCFDWGIVKCFEWCPFPYLTGSTDRLGPCLGLLATVHGDGKVRVLDISHGSITDSSPQYLKVDSVSFEALPPDTVFTCLAWLSSKTLAAGCANGYVAIWDIEQHIFNQQKPSNPRPIFYEPFHDSFVTEMKSCQPYLPHFLLTTGQDGYVRLCDIRDPLADVAYANRHRLGLSIVAWHPHLNHVLIADDMVAGVSIRRFSTTTTAIVHLSASATAIATSPTHSTSVVGCADGSVMIFNPMRRCTSIRQRVDSYLQYWVKHEWRQLRNDEVSGPKRLKVEAKGNTKSTSVTQHTTDVGKEPVQGSESGDASNQPQEPHHATAQATNTQQVQREIAADTFNAQENTGVSLLHVAKGLTRLSMGFSVRHVKTMNPIVPTSTTHSKRKAQQASSGKDSINNPATIYEESSRVTSIAWNPNIVCGGWAAVGWGDGLVMISDLCWD